MIKLIKFFSEKIVIVEVMLLLLYFVGTYFGVVIPYLTSFLDRALVFLTPIAVVALIIIVGAIVGLVGAWTKISREKAKVEYEKQQNIGKNKKKKKKAEVSKTNEKTTFVDKIFKK